MAKKNHILEAVKSIAAAQLELTATVQKHGKIIDSQGHDIAMLERKVMELRNNAIHAEVANGVPTKDVAEKYGVTSSRVSQIAPRSKATLN
jgi:DNA-directed RNA polymerase specialized sigma subunit